MSLDQLVLFCPKLGSGETSWKKVKTYRQRKKEKEKRKGGWQAGTKVRNLDEILNIKKWLASKLSAFLEYIFIIWKLNTQLEKAARSNYSPWKIIIAFLMWEE